MSLKYVTLAHAMWVIDLVQAAKLLFAMIVLGKVGNAVNAVFNTATAVIKRESMK